MYIHFNNHIYVTFFRDEAIVLDLKDDSYQIYPESSALMIKELFSKSFQKDNSQWKIRIENDSNDFSDFINTLLSNKIIKEDFFADQYPYKIDENHSIVGVSNIDWRLPLNYKPASYARKNTLRALLTLSYVHAIIKFRGFYSVIQLLKSTYQKLLQYTIPSQESIQALVQSVNSACMLFPKKTKCLEWALTVVLLALKRNWKFNLVVGVQNYPFLAHAWAECDNQVIGDMQELRTNMARILVEPFRPCKVNSQHSSKEK